MTSIDSSNATANLPRQGEIKVWDILVRLFHWSLVATFTIAWLTGDELESVHETTGYIIAGLIGFRLLWGLIGTRHARFSDFIYRPSTVIGYLADSLRGRAKRYIGHNPAGGAMVVALLLTLAVAVASGIAITTDTYHHVRWVKEFHEASATLALWLVGVHILGVIFASREHGENLAKAMLTGRKRSLDET